MPYMIEGELVRQEKPDKYMNQFVDFKLIEETRNGSTRTKRTYAITNSERVAHWLNKMGWDLQWNEDWERALEMCEEAKVEIEKMKLFFPREGWENYLNRNFGETKGERTIKGELKIWEDTRLPLPWLYLGSFGNLQNIFVFDGYNNGNDGFVVEPYTKYKGKRYAVGPALELKPILWLSLQYSRHSITTEQTTNYDKLGRKIPPSKLLC